MKRSGFTVIELLISLGLMAALLSAIAVAVHASLYNYDQNDKIAAATQTSRYILSRLANEVRAAEAVDAGTPGLLQIIPPDNPENVTLVKYQFQDGTLWFRQTIAGEEISTPLLDNTGDIQVVSFDVSPIMGENFKGEDCTKSVTARIGIKAGEQRMTITASAAPRRNQTF